MCRRRISAAGPLLWYFYTVGTVTLTRVKDLNTSSTSAFSSLHHKTLQKNWGVGSKVWGLENHERGRAFFFFFTPLLCVIPWTNARLCVRAPWAQCEDTAGAKTVFGTKRKHFPTPLLWHSAQSPLVVAGFSQHLGFKAAKTFSPRERLTGKIKTCSPYWATMQVNLINAITGLVTKSYQDGVH